MRVLTRGTRTPVGWILAAPAVCVLIQFVLLAAGKPAEYARFGLVAAAATAAVIGSAIHALSQFPIKESRRDVGLACVIAIVLFLNGIQWFARELIAHTALARRIEAGGLVELTGMSEGNRVGLSHEPAPWSVMPLNLFRDQLILTKPAADPKSAIYDVYLYPSNLSSQVGRSGGEESVDWAQNRTGMILGSLPPPTTQATSRAIR